MGTTFGQCDESVTNSFKSDEKNCFKSFASENLVLFDSFGLLSFGVENILSFKEVLKFAGVLNFNKVSRDMMLSDDGDAYYRAELKKRLKGHDKSEWDKIIDDYNHTLKIDETGNIIEIYSFEQGYVASKNGKYDADYTHLVNKKFDELKAQNFEANSVEFWSGVAQIFSGLGVYFASGALEVLSVMAGPPTAGTSIVAGTAASVSGIQYGNVLIASGAVTS